MTLRPFHLAFPVRDLAEARAFWGGVIGCPEGRSAADWVDFDFYGHQIVAHLAPDVSGSRQAEASNPVDGHDVPVPHFGIVLTLDDWRALARLALEADVRFDDELGAGRGQPGEQATMFFRDPAGNAIEMKAFADLAQLFATE